MTVSDASASLKFYQAAFGFKVTGQVMRNDAGAVMHAGMRLGDTAIMFAPQGMSSEMRAPASSGATDSLSLYVYVSDVDALAARAERAGAKVLQRPADQFWGDRIAVFKDPDGYHWTFATNVAEFDATQGAAGLKAVAMGNRLSQDLHAHRRRRHDRARRRHAGAQGASAGRGLWLGRRGIERDRHGARRSRPAATVADCLIEVQHELFDLGGELCIPGHRAITMRT